MSSLKAQLSSLAHNNIEAGRLKTVARRDSYVYSPSQAAKLTIDQVHQIGLDGIQQLIQVDQSFDKFQKPLFGEASKRVDRTLLDPTAGQELNLLIEDFLCHLAPHILNKPSAHAIEWLVRRFRIHEFDVEILVSIFLPFYATPQFMAILNILRLESHPHLSFLQPLKTSRSILTQKHLIDSIISSSELLRFIIKIFSTLLSRGKIYQPLLGFQITTFLGLFKALASRNSLSESFPQPILASILPSIVQGIKNPHIDVRLTSLISLSELAKSSPLQNSMVENLAKSIIEGHVRTVSTFKKAENGEWHEYDEAIMRTLTVIFQNKTSPVSVKLSSKLCYKIAQLDKIAELLLYLVEKIDISALWSDLVKGLMKSTLKGESPSEELLVKFAQSAAPSTCLEIMVTQLLESLITMEIPARPLLRPLGIIYQRHPEIVDHIAQELMADTQTDAKDSIASVLRLLSGDIPLTAQGCDSQVLELSSASAILRRNAFSDILKRVDSAETGQTSFDLIVSTIKAGLTDPDPMISEVLFSFPHAVIKTLSGDKILEMGLPILCSSKTMRSTLKSWLLFLTGPFLQEHPGLTKRVVEEIILDKILWSKSHAKATTILWMLEHDPKIWSATALGGLWPTSMPSDQATDRIATNKIIIDGIVANYLKLGDESILDLSAKLAKRHNPDQPFTRLITMVLLWRMVSKMSGKVLLNLIDLIIDHMALHTDHIGFKRWANTNMQDLDNDQFWENIYSKPSSEKLFARLAAATLIVAIAQLHTVSHLEYCWFEPDVLQSQPPASIISRFDGSTFAKLCFKLYSFGHLGECDNNYSLSRRSLIALCNFVLQEELLVFLARVWTCTLFHENLRQVALLDAANRIKADRVQSKASPDFHPKDYQILIPSLLIALSDPSKPVRIAALDVITSLSKDLPPINSKLTNQNVSAEMLIYAYDKFYGLKASTELQYLSTSDSNQLIDCIHASKIEIALNGLNQVSITLSDLGLGKDGSSSTDEIKSTKKASVIDLKRKVLSFIMKVITCWNDFDGRLRLLKCTASMLDPLKVQYTTPIIEQLLIGVPAKSSDGKSITKPALKEYAALLMSAYVAPGKAITNGKDSDGLKLFSKVLECQATDCQQALVEAGLNTLQSSFFPLLSSSNKEKILRHVLKLASSSQDHTNLYLECLRRLPLDTETFVAILGVISTGITRQIGRVNKKTKTNDGSTGKTAYRSTLCFSELSILLELTSVEKLQPTFPLFKALLDTLSNLLAAHVNGDLDIHFPSQLIISALSSVVPKLTVDQFGSEVVQIGSIVDYMRISPDPHVSQQSILLMAEIARLSPDQICQSMMPIFTFVGTHVLQRDDSSSARVVDKAIQALIPPMVKAAGEFDSSRIPLVLALRDLISMFVGARNHIPKHRRTRLFGRMIEVLGGYNFLGAVLMLLIDADIDVATGSSNFELALSVWESFPSVLGAAAIAHIAAEVETLLGQSSNNDPSILPLKPQEQGPDADGDQIIADGTTDGPSDVNMIRTRVLMKFMNETLSSKSLRSKLDSARATENYDSDQVLAYLMIQLLHISQPHKNSTRDWPAQDAQAIARKVAKLVSLTFLSNAILKTLQGTDTSLVSPTLDLLRTRLPSVKPVLRAELEPCVKIAITICGSRLRAGFNENPTQSIPLSFAIETLGEVSTNALPAEESMLSQFYEPLLQILPQNQETKTILASLSLLIKLSAQLGSRLIPQIRATINVCADLIKKIEESENMTVDIDVATSAYNLIEATLKASSSFVIPHMPIILDLLVRCVEKSRSQQSPKIEPGNGRASLVRSLTKLIRLRDLRQVLSETWSKTDVSNNSARTVLDLLTRAIKHAKVSDVIRESKGIFSLLLKAFDLRTHKAQIISSTDLIELERTASHTFLSMVLKLNDETLKPLLLRLIDWAIVDAAQNGPKAVLTNACSVGRGIVLYQVFGDLLVHLQTLAVPYFTHLVDYTVTLLNELTEAKSSSWELWLRVTNVVEQTFVHDLEGFWNLNRLSKISKPLICQVRLSAQFSRDEYCEQITRLIRKLGSKVVHHDTLLKVLNSGILEELKSSEILSVRLTCLNLLDGLWQELGSALVPFVPETVGGSLIEALEDDEGVIAQHARNVVKRIEMELGESIEGYLA